MGKEIVVFSTALCSPCESLKRFLKEEGVEFKVRDLMMDSEAADLMEENGIRSAPVLCIDGRFLSGKDLSQDNLRKELNL